MNRLTVTNSRLWVTVFSLSVFCLSAGPWHPIPPFIPVFRLLFHVTIWKGSFLSVTGVKIKLFLYHDSRCIWKIKFVREVHHVVSLKENSLSTKSPFVWYWDCPTFACVEKATLQLLTLIIITCYVHSPGQLKTNQHWFLHKRG